MRQRSQNPLLETFAIGFYGFGRYDAPLWFIGPDCQYLQPKPGSTPDLLLELWHRRGQRELEDLAELSLRAGATRYFGDQPFLHRTLGRLARTAISFAGNEITDETVRRYQASRLGRFNGRSALLALHAVRPARQSRRVHRLQSPKRLSAIESIVEKTTDRRVGHIVHHIARHSPTTVIFFDLTHRSVWESVAGTSMAPSGISGCFVARSEGVTYIMMRHPESVGTTNYYFEAVGRFASQHL